MENRSPFLIAIDGRCAAGKTTLTKRLSSILNCSVIHMDHFFLRPEQRTKERLAQAGGNVDRERFEKEVLKPLKAGKAFTYRVFGCHQMSLAEEIEIVPTPVVIIEGAYSCHPEFVQAWDLTIFVDIDKEEQLKRIEKRNGKEQVPMFVNRWIHMEEDYFKEFQVKENCRLLLRQPMHDQ